MFSSALGYIIGAVLSLIGGERSNRANAKEAEKNRDFQQQMSSTSYQRAMLDMKRSGLNPMLAYQQGGASTPGGAQAVIKDALTPAVSSGMQAARLKQELKVMKSNEQNIKQNTRNARVTERILKNENSIRNTNAKIVKQQLPGAKTEGDIDKSTYGKVIRWLGRLNPFGSSAKALVPRKPGGLTINNNLSK